MRVLAVSDEPSNYLWSETFDKNQFVDQHGKVDAIVSCGDLNPDYLQFLSTVFGKRLCYVRGNHDQPMEGDHDKYRGLINVDGNINYVKNGKKAGELTIAGLEGSIHYSNNGRKVQYTQSQMGRRAHKLRWKYKWWNLFHHDPLDIFIAHSDRFRDTQQDRAHTGFKSFNWLIDVLEPRVFLHGHTHHYCGVPEEEDFHGTKVKNIVGYDVIELQ